MKVQTTTEALKLQSLKVAQVRPEINAALAELVNDPTHNIAWTADASHLTSVKPTGTHSLLPGVQLRTAKLSAKDGADHSARQQKLRDASLTLATTTGALLKHQFPKLGGAIDGFECVATSYQAFEAWSDPQRTSIVKPTLKTARAFLDALEMLKSHLPTVVSSQLQTVGLLVKIGDAVFQVYLAEQDTTSRKPTREN